MNALANVYEEIQPKLFAFFYIKTMNVVTAEDLTQDVFYEATRSIHRFNGIQVFLLGCLPSPIIY